jgi:hypothetical protein
MQSSKSSSLPCRSPPLREQVRWDHQKEETTGNWPVEAVGQPSAEWVSLGQIPRNLPGAAGVILLIRPASRETACLGVGD